jgi:hypothetical protein
MSLIDLELIYMEENFKKSGSKNISIELKGYLILSHIFKMSIKKFEI